MGGRIWNKADKGANRKEVHLVGTFFPNNPSAVDNTKNKGNWFTVARTAAGLFTITLAAGIDPPVLLGKWVDLHKLTGADLRVEFVGDYVKATRTIYVRICTIGGVDTDLAANADNQVSFGLFFALNSDY